MLLLGVWLAVTVAGVSLFSFRVSRLVGEPPQADAPSPPAALRPALDRPLAVVLLSTNGTEITDALPMYELLAASGAFTTVTVAAERRVVPLDSALELPGIGRVPAGLGLVPHLSFVDYDRLVGRAPDLLVVPNLTHFTPETERPLLNWMQAQRRPQTTLLSICSGSRVLAAAGLLDGHAATGQHQYLDGLEQRYPAVHWQRGVRWVDDGMIITAGTLTAGIDATLHAIDRLAGRAAAVRAADAVGYTQLHRLDDPAADYAPPDAPDVGFLLHAMSGWGEDTLGVVLQEGVSETALAALLDISALNLAHAYTLSPEPGLVRSRFGLLLAPHNTFDQPRQLDRVVVLQGLTDPAAVQAQLLWAEQAGQPAAEPLISGSGAPFAYDAIIADVARHAGAAVARSDANNFAYPVEPSIVAGWPWTARVIVVPLGAMLLVFGLAVVRSVRERRLRSTTALAAGP